MDQIRIKGELTKQDNFETYGGETKHVARANVFRDYIKYNSRHHNKANQFAKQQEI
jgi:hypothetical protein